MEYVEDKVPFSATEPPLGPQTIEQDGPQETLPPLRTDRLYQIAAVTAGLILLATAF